MNLHQGNRRPSNISNYTPSVRGGRKESTYLIPSLCCSLHRRRHILVWGLQLNQNEVREARGLALVCWEIFPRHGKMGEKFPCLSVCWCFICCVGDSTQISSLAVNHWTPHSSLWSSLFPVFCGLFLLFCEVGCLVCHKKYIVNSNNIWYLSQYYGIARKFNAGLPTCLVWAISLDWTPMNRPSLSFFQIERNLMTG